ncbi:hypothetical protein ACFE33_14570 [Falsihalocynthiibacter sp. SS001]|uniref:hypothetical protein n=1 Tax=Falsihalocynthiibacter sp. SS001 TaxID=3349698 RepID=UPI0036D24709
MSFVRAEVVESIRRYQEALWGVAFFLIGSYGAFQGGFISLASIPVIVAGAAIAFLGARRARFRGLRAKAPMSDGVVEVVEHELTFFSSGIGAKIAVDQVVKIEIETNDLGPAEEDMFWVFYQRAAQPVRIPSGAVGGDDLFDALVAFPGADYERVIAATSSHTNNRFLVWQDDAYFSRRMLH